MKVPDAHFLCASPVTIEPYRLFWFLDPFRNVFKERNSVVELAFGAQRNLMLREELKQFFLWFGLVVAGAKAGDKEGFGPVHDGQFTTFVRTTAPCLRGTS